MFNYAHKEANDAKLAHKEDKYQVLVFQERMGKTILKQATLKSYTCFNMQKLREEHNAVLNSDKDNGTTETI